ncbi:hypothetical protein K502DRAFT_329987 [Neoconidiobolus thromboides FSU 785]|nr:hypothetical protein K502DRAFT_329987 [Neoconidiobolus thromboides FSU 785]
MSQSSANSFQFVNTLPRIATRASILPRPDSFNSSTPVPIQPLVSEASNNVPEHLFKRELTEFYHGPLDFDWMLNTDRLYLALESGLPNEISWAFELLIEWSYFCPPSYTLGNNILLFEKLEEVVQEQLQNFNNTLSQKRGNLVSEHFLVIMLILRNFSLIPANAKLICNSKVILKTIKQLMNCEVPLTSFMDTKGYPELTSHCFDLFENICSFMRMDKDVFLSLYQLLNSYDRSKIIFSLRCMSRILLGKECSKASDFLQSKVYVQRAIELITLSYDEELVCHTAEFFSLYAYFALEDFSAFILSFPGNLYRTFLNLLRTYLSDKREDPLYFDASSESAKLKESKQFQNWLSLKYQANSKMMIPISEVYGEFCKLININVMSFMLHHSNKLTKIVLSTFPTAKIVNKKKNDKWYLYYEGICPKKMPPPTTHSNPINTSTSSYHNVLASTTSTKELKSTINRSNIRHYICKWDGCTRMVLTKADELSHFRAVHAPHGLKRYYCKWDNCQQYPNGIDNRTYFIEHFKVHLIDFTASYDLPEEYLASYLMLNSKNIEPEQETENDLGNKVVNNHEIDDEASIQQIIPQLLVGTLKRLASTTELHSLISSCREDIMQLAIENHQYSNDLFSLLNSLI